MLAYNPRRRPHPVDGELVTFASLRRPFIWPKETADQLRAWDDGLPLPSALEGILKEQKVIAPLDQRDQLFPLRQSRPDGWTNSARGEEIVHKHSGPITVLDALSWDDIAALPRRGAFYYLGDDRSFGAAETCTRDGKIPCARCLLLRFLAGLEATPKLYWALRQGARVAFEQPDPTDLARAGRLSVFGESPLEAEEALPLPDCRECLAGSTVRRLRPGYFFPVVKLISSGCDHGAHLPQMLWLAGEETVGRGGAHDQDEQRGRARAINEALERYAAHFTPATAEAEGIPFRSEFGETKLLSRRRTLLTEPGSLSTGLACRDDLQDAIADGLAEVCERDALARFWLELQQGRGTVRKLSQASARVRGLDFALQHYQLDSYHKPTVICVGRTGDARVVTGAACGPVETASVKALAECLQNAAYIDVYVLDGKDPPESFEDHLGLYWYGQRQFPDLQPYEVEHLEARPLPAPVYHCELTTPDLVLLGIHAVRVQVPGLLHLPMSHHDWTQMLQDAGWPETLPPAHPHPFA